MSTRLQEILALAEAGDEDVILQIQSEIALMPETRDQLMERHAVYADEYADSFAPVAAPVDDDTLARLAEEADF